MSNNHNLPLSVNGVPNTHNPLVVAGILDIIGINLTNTLNDIGANGRMGETDVRVLVNVQKLLRNLRDTYGMQHDASDNCVDIAQDVHDEIAKYRSENPFDVDAELRSIREVARQLGIEDLFDQYLAETKNSMKPSLSDAADAILNDLRESGSIGGHRAV